MKKYTKKKEIKQTRTPTFSVKLDGDLHKELNLWLQLPTTKSIGYHSKSDFVNQAVRDMLNRERGPRFTDLIENEDGDYTLIDTRLVSAENNILVALDRTHKTMICTNCTIDDCDHVRYIWSSHITSTRLASIGFPCSIKHTRYDNYV